MSCGACGLQAEKALAPDTGVPLGSVVDEGTPQCPVCGRFMTAGTLCPNPACGAMSPEAPPTPPRRRATWSSPPLAATLRPGERMLVRVPFDDRFLTALKAAVPARDRHWDKARQVWFIAPQYETTVRAVVDQYFDEFAVYGAAPAVAAPLTYAQWLLANGRDLLRYAVDKKNAWHFHVAHHQPDLPATEEEGYALLAARLQAGAITAADIITVLGPHDGALTEDTLRRLLGRPRPTPGAEPPGAPAAISLAPAPCSDPAGPRTHVPPVAPVPYPADRPLAGHLLLLDRDGVIMKLLSEGGRTRPANTPAEISLLPDVVAALRQAQQAGAYIALVTNQGGLNLGLDGQLATPWHAMTEADLHALHAALLRQLAAAGVDTQPGRFQILYCPHGTKSGCHCRKPNLGEPGGTGMVEYAQRIFGVTAAENCLMLGDGLPDYQAATNAGIRFGLVPSGFGPQTQRTLTGQVAARPALAALPRWIAAWARQGAQQKAARHPPGAEASPSEPPAASNFGAR